MFENIGTVIGIFVTAIGSILGLIITFKTKLLKSNRVLKGKYHHFRTIRKEYLKDKVNGYFAIQNYLGIRLTKEEMDFIIESPDAYKIMSLIRGASGRYEFNGSAFITKITKRKYVLPLIGYCLSGIPLLAYLSFASDIIKNSTLTTYLILLILVLGVLGPIFLISIFTINDIASARYLEKITKEKTKLGGEKR